MIKLAMYFSGMLGLFCSSLDALQILYLLDVIMISYADYALPHYALCLQWWWFGVTVSVIGCINEVNQHRARLVP